MSVYTSLSRTEIESVLSSYQLAPLTGYTGIVAGIENTNYLLNTAQGDFILTLYERFKVDEVRPYLNFLVQLGQYESYYPNPLVYLQQCYLQLIAGKPAALFPCLLGESVLKPTLNQCQSVASALARFHSHSSVLIFSKSNPRNIEWIQKTARLVSSHLSEQDSVLLKDELNYQLQHTLEHLSQGIIHADLFKDNVLFSGNNLTGMLDFYAACNDCYLLDIAITLNDWCVDDQGVYNRKHQDVFLQAYQQQRVINYAEQKYLPVLLRRASLRFWLSRLEHWIYPKAGAITQQKDPERFKHLLLQHRDDDH